MDHEFETDKFPVVRAKFFKRIEGKRKVRVIVVHSMEAPENSKTAENVARFFQNPGGQVSAHLCIDSDSIVQCVMDNDVAFAAPGANHDGIQLELAGFAKQTPTEWLDPFGILLLNNAANAAAQYCLKYDIPVRRLSNAQLADGTTKGIVSHSQVSQVFKKSDHTDPGKGFPWDHFLERVEVHRAARLKKLGGK
ncbi:MAG TPA: N-acetylmuramoyl-L-alanine amidase [Longimicrobiaceae bacterium]